MIHLTHKMAGTTLVEMLVALVILSLGMYANLRMLTQSISTLNLAGQQQQAAAAIRNLAEIIQGLPKEIPGHQPTATNISCTGDACEPEELFAWFFQSWSTKLARKLPDGQGHLQVVQRNGTDVLQLRVRWLGAGNEMLQRAAYIPLPAGADRR